MTYTKTRANANTPNNFVSVLDYGADPTGNTPSNQAFRDAITNSASSKSIFIPPGTYKITETIELPVNSDLTQKGFYGQYPASLIRYEGTAVDADGINALFKVQGGNVIFEGIVFTTDTKSNQTAIYDMQEMNNRPTYIHNCKFTKFAVAIQGNSNLANIRNNQFMQNDLCINSSGPLMNSSIVGNSMQMNGQGIKLIKKSGSNQSEGLRIIDNTIQASNPAITLACGLEILISGNILDQTPNSDSSCILVDPNTTDNTGTVSALKIVNNYIKCGAEATSSGIRVIKKDGVNIQDILITGNSFNASSPYECSAIDCADAKSINISDNFFLANWISAAVWNQDPYFGAPVIIDAVPRQFISNNNFTYGNPTWMQGHRTMRYQATFDGSASQPSYGWTDSILGLKKTSKGLTLVGHDDGANLTFGKYDPNDSNQSTFTFQKGSVFIRDNVGIYVKTDVDANSPWQRLVP